VSGNATAGYFCRASCWLRESSAMKSRKSRIGCETARWRKRISRSANTVLRSGRCRKGTCCPACTAISSGESSRVVDAEVIDSVGRWVDAKGGGQSLAILPRMSSSRTSRYQSGWFCLAQFSVTVPRVIACIVPLTQIAA
jgi:hypothetical protein